LYFVKSKQYQTLGIYFEIYPKQNYTLDGWSVSATSVSLDTKTTLWRNLICQLLDNKQINKKPVYKILLMSSKQFKYVQLLKVFQHWSRKFRM